MAMKLYLKHKQVSQSTSNRTTRVTVTVTCKWTTKSWNHLNPPGTLKIDGKSYSFRKSFNPNITSSGSATLFSKTVDVKHDSSGKKTLTCSASFKTGTNAGTIKASYSKTLPAISATSPPKTTTTNSKKATITKLDTQNGSDNTLFAAWTWSKSNTKEYSTEWWYDTGNGIWFEGSKSTVTTKNTTYSIPSNARKIRFKVKPIAKTHKVKKKEVAYWTAEWNSKDYSTSSNPPIAPSSAPTVTIEDNKLTAVLENLNLNATKIQYQIVRNDTSVFKTALVDIKTGTASYSCPVTAGSKYKVRARSNRGKEYSDWSDYSSNANTEPSAPSGFKTCKATSSTSIYLEWNAIANTETYDIEYTDNIKHFDMGEGTTVMSGIKTTKYEKIDLESGKEYFFRLRAVNSAGESRWSKISSAIIGKKPEPPTTWSYSNSAIVGESMTLYWVHNAEDGSDQTHAQIEIVVGTDKKVHTMDTPPSAEEEEDDEVKTYTYILDTSVYKEGAKVLWRVRTAGVTEEYGDWSVQRTIDVYARPALELRVTNSDDEDINTVTAFPFYISGFAGPATQVPIGYHISIVANSSYETVDEVGNIKLVNEGDKVYSKYYDINAQLELEITADSIDLETDINYTVYGIVSMNSGLTAESSVEFTVLWEDVSYTPDAEIGIDEDNLTAVIRPYCETNNVTYYKVLYDSVSGTYMETTEEIAELDGEALGNVTVTRYLVIYDKFNNTYTETGQKVDIGDGVLVEDALTNNDNAVYVFIDETSTTYYYETYTETGYTNNENMVYLHEDEYGGKTYFYIDESEESIPVEGVTLSVYRREFDGNFTEIATGITDSKTWVTDPHPALNYAKYRIVAIDDETGAVGFYDVPPVPVDEKSIVIQWNEEWGDLMVSTVDEEDPSIEPEWSGFMLKLPYNISVSNSHSPDVELVEYIGRKYPVPYYGTQLGESASWSAEIDKEDEETLYLIRQLAVWMGDVYVREPSGSGYWAQVTVSYNQKHDGLTIPVTFNIARIEGGM